MGFRRNKRLTGKRGRERGKGKGFRLLGWQRDGVVMGIIRVFETIES